MNDGEMRKIIQDILENQAVDLNKSRQDLIDIFLYLNKLNNEKDELIRDISIVKQQKTSYIISELHDGPLQHLASAVQIAQQYTHDHIDGDVSKVQLQQLISIVNHELDLLRRVLGMSISDKFQERVDLLTQLRELIRSRYSNANITLIVTPENLVDSLNNVGTDLSSIVMDFFKETIRNAQKHGRATRIEISVQQIQWWLRLTTTDNGSGFSREPPKNLDEFQELADSGHLGLAVLAERATPFHGRLQFMVRDSKLGGAQIEMTLNKYGISR